MLEPSPEELAQWVKDALCFVTPAKAGVQALDSSFRWNDTVVPEEPLQGGFSEVLQILSHALEGSVPTNSPGFMAYVPGGGIPSAAVAGFLANLLNRFTGIENQAPGLVRLESRVIEWFCREFGLPGGAFGVLTSGGSVANLTALIAARVKAFGEASDFSKARVYVSDQVHHSVTKAAFMAGISPGNCVSVPTDAQFKLDMNALEALVRRDQELGFKPVCMVGSAGTTNTGAIDPLVDMASYSRRQGIWFHVDAAYGGGFMLCEAGKKRLAGIELADSITFDPHKSLFLPYGTGCLLVRDKASLIRMAQYQAEYLTQVNENSPASLGLELSRDYRGIRLWLPFMLHGAAVFRQALAEKLELTQWLYQELIAYGVEKICDPQLTTIVFKPGNIYERVNALGRVYVAPTRLRGEQVSRVCILSFRTHFEQVRWCLEDIKRAMG